MTLASALVRVNEESAEVLVAEAQAVLSAVQDEERRGRLANLIAAAQEGELDDEDAQAAEEVLSLGLATGRVRALYGPEGEQAALKLFRKLPGGRELSASAKDVTEALDALAGKTLEHVSVQAAGPGAYVVTIGVDGLELSVRLDRSGARLHSVGI